MVLWTFLRVWLLGSRELGPGVLRSIWEKADCNTICDPQTPVEAYVTDTDFVILLLEQDIAFRSLLSACDVVDWVRK